MTNLLLRKYRFVFNPLRLALLSLFLLPFLTHAQNLFPAGEFDESNETYNPWAGVDDSGNIHGLDGHQNAVGDAGNLYSAAFGPSVAVGDLNGDGKPDLVMADSKGFFWFYPNSGTPTTPKFTQGIMMPLWLGETRVADTTEATQNLVPRIQLVDLDHSGKLDIVAGNYTGKLFYLHNTGSSVRPNFPLMLDLAPYVINTRARGVLWCNYLAPCLYNWMGRGILDLIMGEGTYSANSIYLLPNGGSNSQPTFSQETQQKIIPGMGMEQLTPTVIDWNNDGKPDILTGDRTGHLTLFLNTSTDEAHPTFAKGTQISIGGQDTFGGFTTVTVCDLSGNKLPNLLIGNDSGTLLYAVNKGKIGAPSFPDAPQPLQGKNPYPKILVPTEWSESQHQGVPNELLVLTNPTVEPTLKFPAGMTTKNALKSYRFPINNPLWSELFYPPNEDQYNEHFISCSQTVQLKGHQNYTIHMWIKGDQNVANCRCFLGHHHYIGTQLEQLGYQHELSPSEEWSEFTDTFSFDSQERAPTEDFPFQFSFRYVGYGTLYVADITITLAK